MTDDSRIREQLKQELSRHGFEVVTWDASSEARGDPLPRTPTLTIIDLDLAGANTVSPEGSREVFLVSDAFLSRLPTANGQRATHLRKPFAPEELAFALAGIGTGAGSLPTSDASAARGADDGLHGASPQIQGVRKLAEQVASSATHVTITGEAGVGKRRVGRLIHSRGRRASERFLQVGCAGFSSRLLENVFFGGEDGPGCLEEGLEGTLLIDDIDVLDRSLQEQLFRRLERGGARGTSGRQVQVIAVSSRSLHAQVRAGAFHEGLFELLSPAQIEVPPLRERKADIPILADRFARAFRGGNRGIEPAVITGLMRYDWPGNVSELRDLLELGMQNASGDILTVEDLPSLPETVGGGGETPRVPGATIHEIEKDAILRTLEAMGGSTSKAARVLEMSVRKIQYKLKEYRADASSRAATESRPALAEGRRSVSRKTRVATSPGG